MPSRRRSRQTSASLSASWSGWATFVVIGVLSALVGFVFALVPADGRR
ncbi:hypothetical protein [Curtobacterium citreum]|nr:hypothetical protein [Curtobacterium flaccumfaciens]MCS6581984.1 hypothetical protein [Curtobacterium flaccumfaciens pv. beticola]